jgi:hypothetical protein
VAIIAALVALVAAYRVGGQAAVLVLLLLVGVAVIRNRGRTTWTATRYRPAVWLLFAVVAVTFGLVALMAAGGGAGVVVFLFSLFLTIAFMAQANRSADGR